MIAAPMTVIQANNFDFLATDSKVSDFLKTVGLCDENGNLKINQARLPALFRYALAKEIDLGYHFMTYRTSEQYPEPFLMVLEAFYRAMPKIITAWDSYEPSLYGVTYADIWDYSLDHTFTHGHVVTTKKEDADITKFGQTLKTTTTGTQKSVSENAPINADIDTINTPDSKAKDSSEGTSDSTWGGMNTKTVKGVGTEKNSGQDVRHEEEQRSYKNSDRARLFFENFVDAGRDIVSYIHNSCKFMVYEYNIPMF